MSEEENKSRGVSSSGYPPHYGTFQGTANYPPPPPPQHPNYQEPVIGFPQPIAPPGSDPSAAPEYYPHGYQAVPGYGIAEGTPVPVRARRLPCCGIGVGWFLFITGFLIGTLPWYIGLLVLICGRHRIDRREKPGYVACAIAAVIATVVIIILGVARGVFIVIAIWFIFYLLLP